MKTTVAAMAVCVAGWCVPAAAQTSCTADPLAGRTLYLRGSFNAWAADDAQGFTWACNRWELVTRLQGEQKFKIADEAWSADADFGAGPLNDLQLRGPEFKRQFNGYQRFRITPKDKRLELEVESCAAAAPFGDARLYLRGSLNNWAVQDSYAFQYSCDAYYLNVTAKGKHDFKVADATWDDATTLLKSGGTHSFNFDGEHTVRLSFQNDKAQLSVGPRTFADPAAKPVLDPMAVALSFDSRSLANKEPFGATPAGTAVRFAVDAPPGFDRVTLVLEKRRLEGNQEVLDYAAWLRVPLQKAANAARETWSATQNFAEIGVYGYWFEAEVQGRKFALQNNATPVHWTREKGVGGAAVVSELPAQISTIRRFRQTVFSPNFEVPAWAADAVYYYIFPDRFRNGNKNNDPKPGRDRYQNYGVEFHKDWNDKPYKPGAGDGSDGVYNNDFFGGDLAGVIEKLDYIKTLGANTIYMTPVFKAASNHKYDTADYTQIDPAFGNNADFERLTKEAGKRGLRVLPDTSLNHTGSDSVYFNRFGNYGKSGAFQDNKVNAKSPYLDWYSFDITQADPDKQFKGWVGVGDLPELNKASPAFRQFAYGDVHSVMKVWLDRGASGWRMDVAPWVPDDFWREWRKAIKAHKPDAITVAETWFDASKYFLGDMFDSTMNYVFRNAVLDYAGGGKATDLVQQLEHLREAYPPQAFAALMNLVSSHDQARALHVLGFKDGETDSAVVQLAKQRLLLATFIQMTQAGAPAIYYGDEVGVTGGDDPYNRGTYPWADLGGNPDTALLREFKKLMQLRREHTVLRQGSSAAPLHVDAHVVVWARRLGKSWAVVAVNNADQARDLSLRLPDLAPRGDWAEPLSGNTQRVPQGLLDIKLPALSGRVWLSR